MESYSDSSDPGGSADSQDHSSLDQRHSDYEELDYPASFNLSNKRKRKFSKEQQMLGIFASDSDSGSDLNYNSVSHPRGHNPSKKSNPLDLSDVSFVKQSVRPGKTHGLNKENELYDHDEASKAPADSDHPKISIPPADSFLNNQPTINNKFTDQEFDRPSFEQSFFSLAPKQSPETNYSNLPFSKKNNSTLFMKSNTSKETSNKQTNPGNISNVALKMMQKMGYKHGRGLGRDESGIVNPIEAISTQGKKGIAYGSRGKQTSNNRSFNNQNSDSSSFYASEANSPAGAFANGEGINEPFNSPGLGSRRNRAKTNYIDVEMMLEKVENTATSLGLIPTDKIVDMTGSEPNEISSVADRNKNAENLANLQSEIQLGLDLSTNKSHSLGLDLGLEKAKLAQFESQVDHVNRSIESTNKQLSILQKLALDMEICQNLSLSIKNKLELSAKSRRVANEDLDIEEYANLLSMIKSIKKETEKYDSANRTVWFDWRLYEWTTGIFAQIAKPVINSWDVQSESIDLIGILFRPFIELISDVSLLSQAESKTITKKLQEYKAGVFADNSYFSDEKQAASHDFLTFYYSLVAQLWMPHVRTFLVRDWNVYFPDHALRIFEQWTQPYISQQVTDELVNKVVVRKIAGALESWEINTSFDIENSYKLPHLWIHPWLLYISEHSLKHEILPLLCIKLGSLVNFWYSALKSNKFKNNSANDTIRAAIAPWKGVVDSKSYDKLAKKFIVPNLKKLVTEPNLVVNARSQSTASLELFTEFTRWYDVLTLKDWVEVFSASFIPNWLEYLRSWLSICKPSKKKNSSNNSHENLPQDHTSIPQNWIQISEWYLAWKSLIPEKILVKTEVQNSLRRALWLIQDRIDYLHRAKESDKS